MLAVGFSLLLAGNWQLWILNLTQYRAEQQSGELNRQQEMMATVAQQTGHPVMVTSLDERQVRCNEAFCRLTGYSLEQARGQRPAELLPAPVDPAIPARIEQAVRERAGLDIGVLLHDRDGSERWVQLLLSPIQDAAGQFSGHVGVIANIDEQVKTREALRTSQEWLKRTNHLAGGGGWYGDPRTPSVGRMSLHAGPAAGPAPRHGRDVRPCRCQPAPVGAPGRRARLAGRQFRSHDRRGAGHHRTDPGPAAHRGDAALLQRLRAGFEASAWVLPDQAQSSLARGDARGAAGFLHQLKSGAAAVGADALARADGAAGCPRDAGQLGPLTAEREAAFAALRQWLDTQSGGMIDATDGVLAPPGAAGALLADLETLKAALDRADMDALDLHDGLLAAHLQARAPAFGVLNQAMEQLDPGVAAGEAQRLTRQLRQPSASDGNGA